ncbi:hypothetical protein SEA_JOURNEY13_74 [Mycobacterium phage Journey13]|nr:hypothetical protein SEA_JOURNEY13_74 [Mycobacterium phage Journey13]
MATRASTTTTSVTSKVSRYSIANSPDGRRCGSTPHRGTGNYPATNKGVTMATVRETLIAEYGEDWERQLSHIVSVDEDRRWAGGEFPKVTEYVVFNHTMAESAFDYVDPLGVANYRVLSERWKGLAGLTDGPYSNSTHIALDLDSEAPEDLVGVIEALGDYLVLDEDEYSRAEQEMIDDYWSFYGESVTLDAIAKAIGQDRLDLSDAVADIACKLTFLGVLDYGAGGGYPTMDGSAYDFGTEDVARFVAEHYGTVVTVKANHGYGPDIELDLRESNLLDL